MKLFGGGNGGNHDKQEQISEILQNNPFDRLCFDDFQSILSFLPPIPYLFQLQRVSKSWLLFCNECMLEECSELHWDDTFVYSLPPPSKSIVKNQNSSSLSSPSSSSSENNSLSVMMENILLKLVERTFEKKREKSEWFLFFRMILKHFRKLDKLILKNIDITDPLFFFLLCEWKGSLKKLCLVNCTFKLSNEMFPRRNDNFSSCEFILPRCCLTVCNSSSEESLACLKKGIENCQIEQVSLAFISSSWIDFDRETRMISMCVFKCFPKLKRITSFPLENQETEREMFSAALPHVEHQFDSYTRACNLLEESKDLELVLKFHFKELIEKYFLRRNRLELYQLEFLNHDEQKIRTFHCQLKNIYEFLHSYSYNCLDSRTNLDMKGRNIINYALMHAEIPTIEFIIRYLAIGNNRQDSKIELNELFSSTNKLDGISAIIPFVKSFGNVDLLIEYGISMNHKSKDGSTLAHYLCHYGKVSVIKEIEKSLKKLPTQKERLYFFDVNLKNNNNETPFDICLREGNETIYNHLKNSEIFNPPTYRCEIL